MFQTYRVVHFLKINVALCQSCALVTCQCYLEHSTTNYLGETNNLICARACVCVFLHQVYLDLMVWITILTSHYVALIEDWKAPAGCSTHIVFITSICFNLLGENICTGVKLNRSHSNCMNQLSVHYFLMHRFLPLLVLNVVLDSFHLTTSKFLFIVVVTIVILNRDE